MILMKNFFASRQSSKNFPCNHTSTKPHFYHEINICFGVKSIPLYLSFQFASNLHIFISIFIFSVPNSMFKT